jgi:hypothetical protein
MIRKILKGIGGIILYTVILWGGLPIATLWCMATAGAVVMEKSMTKYMATTKLIWQMAKGERK